jgi:hypothetical protein
LGRAPSSLALGDAIDNEFFRIVAVVTFALHSLVVDHGIVSSWLADSRRAIAHESGSHFGFFNVALTMIRAHFPGTGDLMCCGAGCRGNLELVARALQATPEALPRFVNLSNWTAREFDVSLEPHEGRNGQRHGRIRQFGHPALHVPAVCPCGSTLNGVAASRPRKGFGELVRGDIPRYTGFTAGGGRDDEPRNKTKLREKRITESGWRRGCVARASYPCVYRLLPCSYYPRQTY